MTIERLQSGIPGLDVLTHGGLPKGRTTLVLGKSGTGKSVLALQFACAQARQGSNVLLLAVEESPDDLAATGGALEFGFQELLQTGRLSIMDLTPGDAMTTSTAGEYEIEGLVQRIRGEVESKGVDVVVIDSSTALFSGSPPRPPLRRLFFHLVYSLRRLGVTAIVTAESHADYENAATVLGVEEFVCDVVISLRNVTDGERRRRTLEVHKYRRSAHHKGEYPCTITRHGLSVFPLDSEEKAERAPVNDRFSSGVAGLDRMNNGGWLRDSIVMVRGPTGSGKTTLAAMYARSGALRGERVAYFGFEEPRPILMRNLRQIGLPVDELLETGNFRLQCRFPEAMSPEDLLIVIRTQLEEYKPSLIVIDSVSSLEHATSAATFRHFMIGLASLLRLHGRSALLTQTIPAHSEAEQAAPYLSTMCDSIVVMDYSTNEPEMARTMRVLKMRGSNHSTEQHRVTFGHQGLEVEPIHEARPSR